MKRNIKQIISLVIVFLLLGGCAGAQKNLPSEMQTSTSALAETVEETVLTTDSAAFQTPAETTEITEKASSTAAKTTVRQTTAKTVETTVVKTTTTKPTEITAAKTTTTKPAETTKSTTAKLTETTAAKTTTEAKVTSAAKETTAQVQNDEGVIIGLKSIRFGCEMQTITDALGSPSETVTEELIEGGTVKNLVYAEDYGEYKVFQLLNGKFFGFYTCADDIIVTDGDKSYSLLAGGKTEIGRVKITVYKDSKKGDDAYAFKACFNGFGYYPHELKSLDGQERLIFHTTNAVRAINGLYSFSYSGEVSDCVRAHCADMSERDYFSHDTPEGLSSAQRMEKSGIDFISCGENLAAGYQDAFGMVDGWYNSTGHRKNLLDKDFRYLGVGVVEGNESYNIYAGQNFYR